MSSLVSSQLIQPPSSIPWLMSLKEKSSANANKGDQDCFLTDTFRTKGVRIPPRSKSMLVLVLKNTLQRWYVQSASKKKTNSSSLWQFIHIHLNPSNQKVVKENGICCWPSDCRRETVLPPPPPAKEESKPFIYKKRFRQKQEVIKRRWSGFQLISKFIKICEANLWIKAWLLPKQSDYLSLCKDKQ